MLTNLKTAEWAEAEVVFRPFDKDAEFTHADEVHILLPEDGELLIDDLLLYVP